MQFTDSVELTGVRELADGYLATEACAVRIGIQTYLGSEVGVNDKQFVKVYRPEDEVRSPASLATFSHAPVTLDHPAEPVTKDNWADLAKGEVSTEAQWIDGKIKLPLIVKDSAAIDAIKNGKRELSAGYTCDLDFTAGITEDGEAYDAVQRNIRINHLAIVQKGRAGSECRIGDSVPNLTNWGAAPITNADKEIDMTLRTILVDGLSVQTTDQGAQAIEKLQGQLADSSKALADANTAHKGAIEAKDTEIGELKGEVQKLKDAQPDAAMLDKMVADRTTLIGQVQKLDNKIKVDGVADADLRKTAVASKMGDAAVADASEAEIKGMFKALTAGLSDSGKTTDPVAQRLGDGGQTNLSDEAKAYQASIASLNPARS